jgi:hypothetical protein
VPVFDGFEAAAARATSGGALKTWPGNACACPMLDVRREDPCSLALTLRLVRRLRGIKQAHAAELLGVTQSTVSRIERARLPDLGWRERDGTHALNFVTEANGSDELPIVQGVLIWERILLSDGSPARLVTSPAETAPV